LYYIILKFSLKFSPYKINFFESPLDALYKSVILFHQFKKCKFLALKGGNQNNLLCNGGILKEFLVWGNAKHAHLAGG
jgi:hypothetical protein